VKLLRCERGGKVSAQNRGVGESAGDRRLLRRECALAAGGPAESSFAASPIRPSAMSLVEHRTGSDGTNREGAYWRFELWLRAQESRLGSVGRQWAHLCRAPFGLGRRPAVVRSRPGTAVPDGAARRRAVCDLRPSRSRSPRATSRTIPPQGADAARRLGACLPRNAATRRAGLYFVELVAPAPAVRQWDPPPGLVGLERHPRRQRLDLPARSGAQLLWLLLAGAGSCACLSPVPGLRTTTSS
jgi:hypothetical protein